MTAAWTTLAIPAGLGAAGVAGVLSYGAFHPRSRLFAPVIYRGTTDDPPRVALTFDDGPDPEGTPAILDLLAEHGAKACFFVIGRHAERWAGLVKRIDDEGHLIGNHSHEHSHFGMFRRGSYWRHELHRAEEAIAAATGRRPAFFRPPMGFKHMHIARAAREQGLRIVTWTRRGLDGRRTTAERILRRLAGRAQAGDILGLHDGREAGSRRPSRATVEAVGPLIEALRARGLGPCRLDELIGQAPYRPEDDVDRPR